MSYTPGPWTIKGPSDGKLKGIDDGGDYAIVANNQIIAEAIYRTDLTIYQPVLANAHLIAAAPDLLLTLKSVLEYITHQEGSCPSGMRLMDATKAMRQAITQAEGVT